MRTTKKTRAMIQRLLDEHICDMNEVINEGRASVRITQANPTEIGWVETLALKK